MKTCLLTIIAGHYAVGEYIDENALHYLQLMPNDIYYEYCVGMSYKTWPFKGSVDSFILQVAESGIQKYWELQVMKLSAVCLCVTWFLSAVFDFKIEQTVKRYSDNKIQLGISLSRHRDQQGPIRLTPAHISGALILWGIGIGLSTVIFLIEFMIARKSKRTKVIFFADMD